MSRDFEFKQLLRAYRSGVINEQTFEQELVQLEHGSGNGDGSRGFQAMGKTYGSEREAVIAMLDRFRARGPVCSELEVLLPWASEPPDLAPHPATRWPWEV